MTKDIEKTVKAEDLWDCICSHVGFDKNGKEIQDMIRKFVELKLATRLPKEVNKI